MRLSISGSTTLTTSTISRTIYQEHFKISIRINRQGRFIPETTHEDNDEDEKADPSPLASHSSMMHCFLRILETGSEVSVSLDSGRKVERDELPNLHVELSFLRIILNLDDRDILRLDQRRHLS